MNFKSVYFPWNRCLVIRFGNSTEIQTITTVILITFAHFTKCTFFLVKVLANLLIFDEFHFGHEHPTCGGRENAMRSHILSFETPKKQERVVGGDRLRWSGLSRAGGLGSLGAHQLLAQTQSHSHASKTKTKENLDHTNYWRRVTH